MLISTLAVLFCLGLVAFGAWVIKEGDRAVAKEAIMVDIIRTNQAFVIASGGMIGMMTFILLGLVFAPRTPMLDWTVAVLFAMPFAPLVGALGALAFKKFKTN